MRYVLIYSCCSLYGTALPPVVLIMLLTQARWAEVEEEEAEHEARLRALYDDLLRRQAALDRFFARAQTIIVWLADKVCVCVLYLCWVGWEDPKGSVPYGRGLPTCLTHLYWCWSLCPLLACLLVSMPC